MNMFVDGAKIQKGTIDDVLMSCPWKMEISTNKFIFIKIGEYKKVIKMSKSEDSQTDLWKHGANNVLCTKNVHQLYDNLNEAD